MASPGASKDDSPSSEEIRPQPGSSASKSWLVWFCGAAAAVAGIVVAGFLGLQAAGAVPPPPLVATPCIDVKFEFLRDHDLKDATLLAVGSSATWRNLDMSVFKTSDDVVPLNAAPCFLHVNQTAYMADALLDIAPSVKTVVTVLAPRDFEACPASDTKFFNRTLAQLYIERRTPAWAPYIANPRASYIVLEGRAINDHEKPGDTEALHAMDAYGTNPMPAKISWRPPPVFDEHCYASLHTYALRMKQRGVQLVLATVPVMPEWAAAYDPDGAVIDGWIRRIKAEITPETIFIDGRSYPLPDSQFGDPVHLLAPAHIAFSRFIAEALSKSSTAGQE